MLLNKDQSILNDELSSLSSPEKHKNIKKYLVILISSLVLLALIIIILLILLLSKSKTQKSIGEINCILHVEQLNEIKILGDEFIKDSEFDIFIDNKKIKFTKKYKFDKIQNHTVLFKLYENINMNYMFKDVDSLLEVNMNSEFGAKVLSFISSF